MVIYLMTKPSDDEGRNPGFLIDRNRMNVALSRAQKVMVIIGNLAIRNSDALQRLGQRSRNRVLVRLLRDVTQKGHTLTWAGPSTVTELEQPAYGFRGYFAHDSRQAKNKRLLQSLPALPFHQQAQHETHRFGSRPAAEEPALETDDEPGQEVEESTMVPIGSGHRSRPPHSRFRAHEPRLRSRSPLRHRGQFRDTEGQPYYNRRCDRSQSRISQQRRRSRSPRMDSRSAGRSREGRGEFDSADDDRLEYLERQRLRAREESYRAREEYLILRARVEYSRAREERLQYEIRYERRRREREARRRRHE